MKFFGCEFPCLWSESSDNLKTTSTILSFADGSRLSCSKGWWDEWPLKSTSWKWLTFIGTRCCLPLGLWALIFLTVLSIFLHMVVSVLKLLAHPARSFTKIQMLLKSGKKIKENFCAWCAGMGLSSVKSDLYIVSKTRNKWCAKVAGESLELHRSKLQHKKMPDLIAFYFELYLETEN